MLHEKELSRRELVEIIRQQHEFYTSCIDRISKVLIENDLPEYSRMIVQFSKAYGLDVNDIVKKFHIGENFLTFGQLYDTVVNIMLHKDYLSPWDIKAHIGSPFSESTWQSVLRTLRHEGKLETKGATNNVQYKLVA